MLQANFNNSEYNFCVLCFLGMYTHNKYSLLLISNSNEVPNNDENLFSTAEIVLSI